MPAKAEESAQVKKARQKIHQQIKAAEKKINQNALDKMSRLIKEQLNRKKTGRINLKDRQITTLDENRRYAKTKNKFILNLIQKLEAGKLNLKNELEGRVKTLSDKNG